MFRCDKNLRINLNSYMNKFKEAELRENQIGTDFTFCPSDQVTRVYINGEIVSAQNFPQNELFISYKITLPSGWKTQLPDQYQSLDLSDQESKQLNCLESVTQSTSPVLENNPNGSIKTRFFFCFPIDLQMIVKNYTTQWPIIHFQIYSKDFWDRILIHGCGFVKIPSSPGYHQLSVETWKPNTDLKTRISEFFLGGLIRAKNLEDISKSEKLNQMDQPGPINRYMFSTLSSGTLNLTLNIATQSKAVKDHERANFKTQKISEQTELRKKQLGQSIPSFVNTGSVLGGRFTNTKL